MSTKVLEQTVTDLQLRVVKLEKRSAPDPAKAGKKPWALPKMTPTSLRPCGWVPNGGQKRTGRTGEPMFVVLDTNHFAELVHDTVLGGRLKQRLKQAAQVFTTIITTQEVTEGWCAFIRKQKAGSAK